MASRRNKNSFQKGIGQVKKNDLLKVKQSIMKVTGITSKASWYNRLYGKIIPNNHRAMWFNRERGGKDKKRVGMGINIFQWGYLQNNSHQEENV